PRKGVDIWGWPHRTADVDVPAPCGSSANCNGGRAIRSAGAGARVRRYRSFSLCGVWRKSHPGCSREIWRFVPRNYRDQRRGGWELAVRNARKLVGRGSQLVLIGDYTTRTDFPWKLFIRHELEISGSNASAGAWDEAVKLAVEGRLPLDRLITHRFPAQQFEE